MFLRAEPSPNAPCMWSRRNLGACLVCIHIQRSDLIFNRYRSRPCGFLSSMQIDPLLVAMQHAELKRSCGGSNSAREARYARNTWAFHVQSTPLHCKRRRSFCYEEVGSCIGTPSNKSINLPAPQESPPQGKAGQRTTRTQDLQDSPLLTFYESEFGQAQRCIDPTRCF